LHLYFLTYLFTYLLTYLLTYWQQILRFWWWTG